MYDAAESECDLTQCCPTAAAAAASSTNNAGSGAVSAPASPASLNKCPTPGKCGANSRIQDPVSIARARSFAWTDLTVEQQVSGKQR